MTSVAKAGEIAEAIVDAINGSPMRREFNDMVRPIQRHVALDRIRTILAARPPKVLPEPRQKMTPMLGALIKAWRGENRYGVRATAKMIGVSPATLSRVENGEAVDQWTMMKLLRWLFEGKSP